MRRRTAILLQVGLVAAGVFFAGLFADWPLVRLVAKPIPALCIFVWLVALAGRDARLVAIGMVFSLVGDICLEASPRLFVPGLVAFLLAHVVYIAAYLGRTRALHLLRLLPVAAYCALAYRWFEPNLGAMKGPVIAYIVVLGAMMWRAAAQIGERPRAPGRAWAAAIGALMFGLSDTMVAYNRFVERTMAVTVVLMILYWAAQVSIAASVERED